jgi:hypothetical protein
MCLVPRTAVFVVNLNALLASFPDYIIIIIIIIIVIIIIIIIQEPW